MDTNVPDLPGSVFVSHRMEISILTQSAAAERGYMVKELHTEREMGSGTVPCRAWNIPKTIISIEIETKAIISHGHGKN
jgi:hypothetical protein